MTNDPFARTRGHMQPGGYAGGAIDSKTHYPPAPSASPASKGGAGGAIDSPAKGALHGGPSALPKDGELYYHAGDAKDRMETPNGLTSPIAAEMDPKLRPHDASDYAQPPVKGDADSENKPGRVDPNL